MLAHRRSPNTWARSLPAALRPEQIRDLHRLSRKTNRTIRRITTDAVTAVLDEARESSTRAA